MKKKLSNEELITFCGQMALILKSGISSLEGIYIMEDGDVQTEGREILKEIREELEMCGMLYPAMKKTGVFPEYALHMTEIGEQTGRLDETMEALAAYYQREEEILDAVKSAVTGAMDNTMFISQYAGSCDGHATERILKLLYSRR